MKVVPLAADSLGVRSMATYVEVADTGILIDPGATLAPSRFTLPPSTEEWDALRRANDRISAYAARASLIFISHYHDDHFRSDPATSVGRGRGLARPAAADAALPRGAAVVHRARGRHRDDRARHRQPAARDRRDGLPRDHGSPRRPRGRVRRALRASVVDEARGHGRR